MSPAWPHITVVIPTRERCDVFAKCLLTCTSQDYDRLTILVSDNMSGDDTKAVATRTGDKRIIYVNTAARLSMSGNYEFSLGHVTDGWVTIIGDDDGLMPHAVKKVAELIRQHADIRAIRSATCHYRWPGVTGNAFGDLAVPLRRGIELRNSHAWLNKVMSGVAPYPNLPMLYSGGFVDVSLLAELKAKRGAFYFSSIPDVYSAMAISRSIDRYLYVFEPLALDGVSNHSIGTSLVRRTKADAAQKFFSEGNMPWHRDLPTDAAGRVPRVHQAWIYESYLQSRFLGLVDGERTHEDQLRVTLARPDYDEAAHAWAEELAARHGIDFARARQDARMMRMQLKANALRTKLARTFNTFYLTGRSGAPLTDVQQASQAAGQAVAERPSTIEAVCRLGEKAFAKMRVA
jgi:glycosyltransferase involved in cell wall biosynthesis